MIVDNEVTWANTCTLILRLSLTHQKIYRSYMCTFRTLFCRVSALSNSFLCLDSSRTVVLRHGPGPVWSDLQKDVLQKSRDHTALCNPREGTLRSAKPFTQIYCNNYSLTSISWTPISRILWYLAVVKQSCLVWDNGVWLYYYSSKDISKT